MSETSSAGIGKLSLVTKLCAAGAAIGWIEKSGRNQFHGYNYATEADLVAALRGELYKRGVFIFPTVLTQERKQITVVSRDKTRETALTDVMIRWTFVDGETGEKFECDVPGCGEDSGDKGIYKAMTGSEKYLLMKAFLIPTGDDPEKDTEPERKEAFQNGKEAAQAVAQRKIAEHKSSAAQSAAGERGAVGGRETGATPLKIVHFREESITRQWKTHPHDWQRLSGSGMAQLINGLEQSDPYFKAEFMYYDEAEMYWYVLKLKADVLADAAVSMGLDAKKSPKVAESKPSDPIIHDTRLIAQGVSTPFLAVKWGDTEFSVFDTKLMDLLGNAKGYPASFELTAPKKKNGREYRNLVRILRIGKRTFSQNVPDKLLDDLNGEITF